MKNYIFIILTFVRVCSFAGNVEHNSYYLQGQTDTLTDRPNIIIILADDLGYGDLACFGHSIIQTPNLDRLSSEGLKLLNCYAPAANCSPSRASIMTGRIPYKVGIYNQIPMMSPMHLPIFEITIAEMLKEAGYATCMVGKWHLNGLFNLPGQPQPDDCGFNYWFAIQNNALPNHKNPYNFVRNGIPQGAIQGFSGPIVASEAVHWLNNLWNKSNPFFLYVAFNEPHEPIRTADKFESFYVDDFPDDHSRVAYYGNVTQMDNSVGQILNCIDSLGIADNTIIWFTSDNGPARTKWHNAGSTNKLRGAKGQLYEGGIRVPGIIRWPNIIKNGTTSEVSVSGLDIFQTICEVTNIDPPTDRILDGASIVPLFSGNRMSRDKPLFWEYIYERSKPKFEIAMLDGQWKLLGQLKSLPYRSSPDFTDQEMKLIKNGYIKYYELYNIVEDPWESKDLADHYPEKVNELKKIMEMIHSEVKADAPIWPAFKYSYYESSRIVWPDYTAKPIIDK